VKDENGDFRKLRVQFKDRKCSQKCMFVIYRMLRIFFVSFYFYFFPFLTIMISIMVPIRIQDVFHPLKPVLTTF
jgi:hypothetical protein